MGSEAVGEEVGSELVHAFAWLTNRVEEREGREEREGIEVRECQVFSLGDSVLKKVEGRNMRICVRP